MVTSISQKVSNINRGFSVFDWISYSDSSLPFGNVLSADRVREIFADSDALFGLGENDLWNTGLTLWSFIGQCKKGSGAFFRSPEKFLRASAPWREKIFSDTDLH